MPAPKGNKNGVSTRYRSIANESTANIAVRVPVSQLDQIELIAKSSGRSKSETARNAIAHSLTCPLTAAETAGKLEEIASTLDMTVAEMLEAIANGALSVHKSG